MTQSPYGPTRCRAGRTAVAASGGQDDMRGGTVKRIRTTVAVAAGVALVVIVAASAVSAGVDGRSASAGATQAATGCEEAAVREGLDNSGAIAEDLDYEITYLKCAEGFGWAVVDPIPENFDTGTALLRVSGTEIEVLTLGTSFCTADFGIPADVAAQIAPPGVNPAGDCPTPVPPSIMVSPATAAQGDTVTISGNHPIAGDCAPGDARLTSTAELFPPDGFGPLVPSDASGNFTMTYTIPTSTPPGTYSIGMRCGGSNIGVSATLQVTPRALPAAPVPAEPSFTG